MSQPSFRPLDLQPRRRRVRSDSVPISRIVDDGSGGLPNRPVVITEVASESQPNRWYTIWRQPDGSLFCECKDFIMRRRARGELCKHLRGLQDTARLRPMPAVPPTDLVSISIPRFLILDISGDG